MNCDDTKTLFITNSLQIVNIVDELENVRGATAIDSTLATI